MQLFHFFFFFPEQNLKNKYPNTMQKLGDVFIYLWYFTSYLTILKQDILIVEESAL